MTDLEVRTWPTQYTVCALPEDDIEWYHWAITVEHRGDGKWAVCHMGSTMTKTGRWTWERSSSNRGEGYLRAHRHDLDTALSLAQEAALTIKVNGMTPAGLLEWRAKRREGVKADG
jgi:hypothetical protein